MSLRVCHKHHGLIQRNESSPRLGLGTNIELHAQKYEPIVSPKLGYVLNLSFEHKKARVFLGKVLDTQDHQP